MKKLVINDTIDSRDFLTMRDKMPNLAEIDLSNAVIAAYNGLDGSAGDRVYRYAANEIPDFAFYNPETSVGKSSLTTIIFPDSLTAIRDFAFNNTGLTGRLDIPADTIGKSAFSFCYLLSGVSFSNIKSIEESAFQGCSSLSGSLSFSTSEISIKPYAFADCEGISSISIGAGVTEIGVCAFKNTGLAFNVDASNPNFSSEDGVLFNADKTYLIQFPAMKDGSYSVPNGVTTIGTYSFSGCKYMTTISFPSTVNMIEDYAFSGCTGLSGNFPISSGLSMMGLYVFDGCIGITGFSIASENNNFRSENGALIDKNLLTLKRCVLSKSGSFVIPDDVWFIDNSAFSSCESMTSVTIPATVLSIGQRAFYGCKALTEINALATEPVDLTYSPTAFEEVSLSQCTLYVPVGSLSKYRTANVWKDFYSILEK